MAWETSGWRTVESADAVLVQESQRAFMSRVHGWMFGGLMLTGIMALATVTNESLLRIVLGLHIPLFLVQIAVVLGLTFLAPRMSGPVAAVMFLGYSALTGMTLSIYFLIYTAGSIAQAFFLTAGVYGAMAIYGTVTKKDLGAWGSFLFMGLTGVLLSSVLNIFLRNDGLSFVTSCAAVVVFAGLTAYRHQKLRDLHAGTGFSSAATVSIVGALVLYLDFINLFIHILRLIGKRR